jgi:hypothetical protein
VGDRLDSLKSLLHRAAKAGTEGLTRVPAVAGARALVAELRQRRASLPEAALSRVIAHAPGVRTCMVAVSGERIRVELGCDDGANLSLSIAPVSARFAPRGAKELLFELDPPERLDDSRARDVVGALAAAIARALWGPLLGPAREGEYALVEREGARLRADLRTIPAVRAALESGPLAPAFDVIGIEGFALEDRALRVRIALPFPPLGP